MERSFISQKTAFFGGGLFFVCLLLYWPSFSNDYLWHDDNLYIVENPAVTDGVSVRGVYWAATTRYQNNWMPLTWISYQLESSVIGNAATPKLVVNFALHLFNGCLLIALLRGLGFKPILALFGGGMFLLHPTCLETVAWAASRKGLLAGSFGLLACLLWLRDFRWIALLCLATSLMCKQSWVFLPGVLLLLDLRHAKVSALARTQLGLGFLLAGLGVLMAVWANSEVPAIERVTNLQPFGDRIAWAALALLDQLRFVFLPLEPGISHVAPHGNIVLYILGGLLFVLFVFAVSKTGLKEKGGFLQSSLLLGFAWFLAALLPTLGLVPIGDVWRAERFLYSALPGVIIGCLFLLQRMSSRVLVPLVVVVLVGLFVQSWTYLGKWSSPEGLFLSSFENEPETNHVAAAKLGYFASKAGDDERAVEWFEKALQIEPRNVDAMEGFAVMKAKSGDVVGGRALLERAVELRPRRSSLSFNLALCDLAERKTKEARLHLEKALEKDMTFAPAIRLKQKLDGSSE